MITASNVAEIQCETENDVILFKPKLPNGVRPTECCISAPIEHYAAKSTKTAPKFRRFVQSCMNDVKFDSYWLD